MAEKGGEVQLDRYRAACIVRMCKGIITWGFTPPKPSYQLSHTAFENLQRRTQLVKYLPQIRSEQNYKVYLGSSWSLQPLLNLAQRIVTFPIIYERIATRTTSDDLWGDLLISQSLHRTE